MGGPVVRRRTVEKTRRGRPRPRNLHRQRRLEGEGNAGGVATEAEGVGEVGGAEDGEAGLARARVKTIAKCSLMSVFLHPVIFIARVI